MLKLIAKNKTKENKNVEWQKNFKSIDQNQFFAFKYQARFYLYNERQKNKEAKKKKKRSNEFVAKRSQFEEFANWKN